MAIHAQGGVDQPSAVGRQGQAGGCVLLDGGSQAVQPHGDQMGPGRFSHILQGEANAAALHPGADDGGHLAVRNGQGHMPGNRAPALGGKAATDARRAVLHGDAAALHRIVECPDRDALCRITIDDVAARRAFRVDQAGKGAKEDAQSGGFQTELVHHETPILPSISMVVVGFCTIIPMKVGVVNRMGEDVRFFPQSSVKIRLPVK